MGLNFLCLVVLKDVSYAFGVQKFSLKMCWKLESRECEPEIEDVFLKVLKVYKIMQWNINP